MPLMLFAYIVENTISKAKRLKISRGSTPFKRNY